MVEILKQWIDEAKSVVFFGGAGLSTESGVPDFRSATGIYSQVQGAENILTPRFLRAKPEAFYDFYRQYFILDESIQPNAAHLGLAKLEAMGKLDAVITQNIDNLHQRAGSQNVIELHGTAETFTCRSCQMTYTVNQVKQMDHVPQCDCGQVLRSDIVMFEEGLDEYEVERAFEAIRQSDLLIIGGTSLSVYPAASFIHYQKSGAKKVLINLEPSHAQVDLQINRPIGQVFTELMELYEEKK